MTQAPGTGTVIDYERTLILAIELSNTSWVLAAQPPGAIVGMIDTSGSARSQNLACPVPRRQGRKGSRPAAGYTGEVPQSGYHVLKAPLNNYNTMVRGIVQNNDPADAVQRGIIAHECSR